MKQIRRFVWFVLVATALGMAQEARSAPAAPAEAQQSLPVIVSPAVLPSPVRILSPTQGQTLKANFIHLRWELAQPALGGEPTFLVQLDAADPINTGDTDYTFSDLQPGTHTIRVTLVDANNVPQGSSATVQFKVPSDQRGNSAAPRGAVQRPGSTLAGPTLASRTVAGTPPAAPIPPELSGDGDPKLPMAGSPLPLLSLIGFGLLIGGAAQAMRRR